MTDQSSCRRLAVHGEPCTVFFDKDARSFYIGPVFYKQEFMDRPGRYDHIMDLDWLPNARPDGQAGQAGQAGIAGPTSPAASGGKTEKASRPPTAWTAFMQEKLHEMREENPNVAFGEVSKEASREWKVASDKDKNFFKEVAKYWAGGADEADEADDADED